MGAGLAAVTSGSSPVTTCEKRENSAECLAEVFSSNIFLESCMYNFPILLCKYNSDLELLVATAMGTPWWWRWVRSLSTPGSSSQLGKISSTRASKSAR